MSSFYITASLFSMEGCTSVTFATGNGKRDASRKVEVFTDGAWSSIPSSCTDKGSTCQYNVCADSLKIKVGDDGWKTTITANGQVLNDASIKSEEVAYTLPEWEAWEKHVQAGCQEYANGDSTSRSLDDSKAACRTNSACVGIECPTGTTTGCTLRATSPVALDTADCYTRTDKPKACSRWFLRASTFFANYVNLQHRFEAQAMMNKKCAKYIANVTSC